MPVELNAARPTAATAAVEPALRATAQKFETAFLTPMVDEMLRSAGPASFGAGNAEEVWRSFMAGAIAEQITQSGSTGIADSLARQMKAYGQ